MFANTHSLCLGLCTVFVELTDFSFVVESRYPERIKFLLVIPSSANELEYLKLKVNFPKASIEIIRYTAPFLHPSVLILTQLLP